MNDIETVILQNLIYNSEYFESIITYMDYKLFTSTPHKIILKIILNYYRENESRIPYDILGVRISQLENISAEIIKQVKDLYSILKHPEELHTDLILKETEEYIRYRKIYEAISDGAENLDNKKSFSGDYIKQMEDAIYFKLDNSVGYDYFANISNRFELYKENIVKIPTSIDELNNLTNGGIQPKTINCVISSTGGGKSVWLCQEATYNVQNGKNVLYITLEMSEVEIAKRIDANLINIRQDDLKTLSPENTKYRFEQLKSKTFGKLIIKEFPADSITTLDIKKVIEELKRNQKIEIDMLIVDYLGLMGSYRYSTRNNNSYSIGKHATEELRSLAVQYNIPVWTAIQFNRGAENAEEAKSLGLGQVSDSYGIPMGLDFSFAILHTDSMTQNGKAIFKILKNRYGESKNSMGMFTVKPNWGCARFENDPDCVEIRTKDDSNTKDGKKMDEKLKEKKETNKIPEEDPNTFGDAIDDLF